MGAGLASLNSFIALAVMIWFVYVSVLIITKLDKVIELLGKKQ